MVRLQELLLTPNRCGISLRISVYKILPISYKCTNDKEYIMEIQSCTQDNWYLSACEKKLPLPQNRITCQEIVINVQTR